MFNSIIVGFGSSGKNLHYACLKKIKSKYKGEFLTGKVGVYDPHAAFSMESDEIDYFNKLEEVGCYSPDNTVVHICTPPSQHIKVLKQFTLLGYKKFIVEKPFVTSQKEVDEVMYLKDRFNLHIQVVGNWLSSSLTKKVKEIIDSKLYGPLKHVIIEQNKPRFSRTSESVTHKNVYEVELPHQVALALFLCGTDVQVVSSKATDMHFGDKIIPNMGYGNISLLHKNGCCSVLQSDLTSPIRKRSIELYFDKHYLVGYYPTSKDDHTSRLIVYDQEGFLHKNIIMADDPLTNCFLDYYKLFQMPDDKSSNSSAEFNSIVVSILEQAKIYSGVLTRKEEIVSVKE